MCGSWTVYRKTVAELQNPDSSLYKAIAGMGISTEAVSVVLTPLCQSASTPNEPRRKTSRPMQTAPTETQQTTSGY